MKRKVVLRDHGKETVVAEKDSLEEALTELNKIKNSKSFKDSGAKVFITSPGSYSRMTQEETEWVNSEESARFWRDNEGTEENKELEDTLSQIFPDELEPSDDEIERQFEEFTNTGLDPYKSLTFNN